MQKEEGDFARARKNSHLNSEGLERKSFLVFPLTSSLPMASRCSRCCFLSRSQFAELKQAAKTSRSMIEYTNLSQMKTGGLHRMQLFLTWRRQARLEIFKRACVTLSSILQRARFQRGRLISTFLTLESKVFSVRV